MILKPLKYLLLFLLALVLLVLLIFSYLIYTEHGSRMAIDFALKQAAIDATYQDISGTLANGLQLDQISYQDQMVTIKAAKLEYQANWSLWNRFVDVNDLQANQVEVWVKQSEEVDKDNHPFAGFQWPLTLEIRHLIINDLSVYTPQSSQNIQAINLKVSAHDYTTEIKNLQIETPDWTMQSSGTVNSKDGLHYHLTPTIIAKTAEWQASSEGSIDGDLQQLKIKQQLTINHPKISGHCSLNGNINALFAEPVLDIKVTAAQTTLHLEKQALLIRKFSAALTGQAEDLKLTVESSVSSSDLPPVRLIAAGRGNTQQLQIQQAQLITDEGILEFAGNTNWQDGLQINGQLQLRAFNPAQLLAEWPGELNGTAFIDLNTANDGLYVSSHINRIQGQLKNQPFEFSGQLDYNNKQIQADQLKLNLGNNTLQANGIISADQVNMAVSMDWNDLSLLDTELTGQLNGTLNINGNHKRPEIQADIKANNLKFKDIQAKQIALNSRGQWQQDLQTSININSLVFKDQLVDQLNIKQQGWLEQHQINIDAVHDELHHILSLTGTYNQALSQWQGVLQQHQLSVPSGGIISLIKPVSIQWADVININPACWQGQAKGTLCLDLNKASQQLTANISVDALSLDPFQMLFPNSLELTGLANGSAKIVLINNELSMESNLEVNDGLLKIWQSDQQNHEVSISKLQLTANSDKDSSTILLDFATTDNDRLTGKAQIIYNSQQWLIDGTLKGSINNTTAIKSLTAEISELEGSIVLDGYIKGQLNQPDVQLNFSQPTGYLRLSRMGTVIEQLNLQVTTSTLQQPKYHINIKGQNLSSINQGHFTSEGDLTLNQAENSTSQWNYQGQLSGQNFMIFNIPELKLHVSPQLDIEANQQSMAIKGDLIFNQGRVVVEQLPPETVANSNDLIIHQIEDDKQLTVYPITFDINANIANSLELDVIGLQALLNGSMQLKQLKGQPLTAKGSLKLEEGRYEVYGQKLDISTGEMIFNGPIDNPKLNVTASRKSLDNNVTAGVQLGGTVNNLQSELFSNPSLSDIEILSYIMTGNGINQGGSINGEQLKQTAILLGLNQSAPVFRQIQNTFGIDVLTIKEAADAEDTVIEAGKKVNDKLYISYNHGIFNRLGFWVLKYKLNQFLNLQTTQGEDQSIELVYTRKAKSNKDN